jgi:signal peptidase I
MAPMDKPKKWVAALLGLFLQFAGLLYVARPGWAVLYFAVALALSLSHFIAFPGQQWAADAGLLLLAVVCAVHAYRVASAFDASHGRPWYSRWHGIAAILAGLGMAAFGVRAFLFEPFRFPSASMEPSIQPGAHVVVRKWGYGNYGAYGIHLVRAGISSEVRRGDIVVFEFPEDPSVSYAKRVVGLPGDHVGYHKKRLTINGNDALVRQVDDYLHKTRGARSAQYVERLDDQEYRIVIDPQAPPTHMPSRHFPFFKQCTHASDGLSCKVPSEHYFVLGDNRDSSSDSRIWGFVPARNIVGKVQYIIQ